MTTAYQNTGSSYVGGGGPTVKVGNATTDVVAFYGVAGAAQAAAITPISTSVGITGAVGFTATQAAAILSSINSIITALQGVGITA